MDCELCELVSGDVVTKFYWEDELSICVDCKTCEIPMTVIKRHDASMTRFEDQWVTTKAIIQWGNKFKKMRKEPRKIHDHAHYHVILEE